MSVVRGSGGQHHSDDACGETEQCALREQLPDEPPASGAERTPDRHLAATRGGAGQQQVGPVGARDQEHQANGAEQNEQRPPDIADRGIPEQRDVEAGVEDRPAGRRGWGAGAGARLTRDDALPPAATPRVAGAETRREQLGVADHTLQGYGRPQSCHGVEEVHAAVRLGLRVLR